MPNHVLYLLVPIVLLALSILGFYFELVPYMLKKTGIDSHALVVSVDHMIARGLRHYFGADAKKQSSDHNVRCDYILTLSYDAPNGSKQTTQITVPATLRISEGKRMPYFQAGNVVPVRCSARFPKMLSVTLEGAAAKRDNRFFLILWGACIVLLLGITVMSVILYLG